MALSFIFDRETNQVLCAGSSHVKEIILNRSQKLNSLNHEMVCLLTKKLKLHENDPEVKLVVLKSNNGKAFCVGGDLVAIIMSSLIGHWTYAETYYRKLLTLTHQVATYRKPMVSLVNGVVMGAGAGLSMNTRFRVVTQNAVFSMPEVFVGFFPDVGSSHFLSSLSGYLGEYIGLTGVRLNGIEMVACGLATHFAPSRKLKSLENALLAVTTSDMATITTLIDKFTACVDVKEDSPFKRLEIINRCFSRGTVEEIIQSLENESKKGDERWINDALHSMRSACPISLKIFLKVIRQGRQEHDIGQCLTRDYIIGSHFIRRTVSNNLYEGVRARLINKDKKVKWEPANLEMISEKMVNQHFKNVDDEDWECLSLIDRCKLQSKL